MPPKELFYFESADFLQIDKPVCVAPKVDVFPFHIIGPHIQPDKFLQGFMLLGRKGKFSLALQQSADHRISAFQFLMAALSLGRQSEYHTPLDIDKIRAAALISQNRHWDI